MCFSPEADLVAGIVVTGIGIDAVRHVTRRELLPLAALPVVFGVHQLVETFVWWHLRGHVADCVGEPAAWIYIVIALCVVPVLVPYAFQRMGALGPGPLGKVFVVAGAASATLLAVGLTRGTMHAGIEGHHIDYHVYTPLAPLTLGLYIAATCLPGLLSRAPVLKVFGATNLAVVALLAYLAQSAVVSLWCVWAAISSILVNVYVRNRADQRPDLPADDRLDSRA